jgi:quercetin 2,3-dioxygenase
MQLLRKSSDRGRFDFEWLKTFHSFSFGEYYDPKHMHFRHLRVFNEDVIAPGAGFPTHPHSDMEIMTVVLSGSIKHKDSMGNEFEIKPGEIQIMSAGTGITHSEFNPSQTDPLHLYQIWIIPDKKGITPRYNMSNYDHAKEGIQLIGSTDGRDGSIQVFQNVDIYFCHFSGDSEHDISINNGYGYFQLMSGTLTSGDDKLSAGDALKISEQDSLSLTHCSGVSALFFDLS